MWASTPVVLGNAIFKMLKILSSAWNWSVVLSGKAVLAPSPFSPVSLYVPLPYIWGHVEAQKSSGTWGFPRLICVGLSSRKKSYKKIILIGQQASSFAALWESRQSEWSRHADLGNFHTCST
jgi:hypothetical protein